MSSSQSLEEGEVASFDEGSSRLCIVNWLSFGKLSGKMGPPVVYASGGRGAFCSEKARKERGVEGYSSVGKA